MKESGLTGLLRGGSLTLYSNKGSSSLWRTHLRCTRQDRLSLCRQGQTVATAALHSPGAAERLEGPEPRPGAHHPGLLRERARRGGSA